MSSRILEFALEVPIKRLVSHGEELQVGNFTYVNQQLAARLITNRNSIQIVDYKTAYPKAPALDCQIKSYFKGLTDFGARRMNVILDIFDERKA
jgi:hypothetical protein